MKKVILIVASVVLLSGCAESFSGIKQTETHDGYLVECVYASGGGVSCDWDHQVKK